MKSELSAHLDAYYQAQPKVAFSSCELGYIKDAEQNQAASDFSVEDSSDRGYGGNEQQQTFKYTGRWHDWV